MHTCACSVYLGGDVERVMILCCVVLYCSAGVTWLFLAVLSSRQDIINVRDGSALSNPQVKPEEKSSYEQRAKSSSNTQTQTNSFYEVDFR